MKAIVIGCYGGPDQLLIRERPDPKPGAGEILVRVRAAGVNPVDWKIRRGDLRMVFRHGFPYIPGGDVAGEVVDVGVGVTRFRPGEAIGLAVSGSAILGLPPCVPEHGWGFAIGIGRLCAQRMGAGGKPGRHRAAEPDPGSLLCYSAQRRHVFRFPDSERRGAYSQHQAGRK